MARLARLALTAAIVSAGTACAEPKRRHEPAAASKPAEGKRKAGPLPFVPPLRLDAPGLPDLAVDEKGVLIGTRDHGPTLAIGGRIHFDASAARLRPPSLGPALSDGSEIRRAWLEPTLTLPNGFIANLQYDFASTDRPVNNALVAFRGFDGVILTAGNFKEPFSLDQLISNNDTLFTERSLLDAFAPARDVGGAVGAHGDRWTAVAGVFGGNINTGIASGGVAGAARFTYAPILTDTEVLHLGLAGSYRALDGGGTALAFDVGPENDLASRSFASTGPLGGATAVARLGLEALYQRGNARVQAEYAVTRVGGDAGSRAFQAGYVQAAWVVNGDGPRYVLEPKHGSEYAVLGGVEVPDSRKVSRGGIGVFEMGARFSAITLQDRGTEGGREFDGTLGINWYPDSNVRLMADYVRAHADPAARALAGGRNADSDSFVGRLQVYW